MRKRTLIISATDRYELEALIDSRGEYLASLEGELSRARIVPSGNVPANVVTMNSVVCLRDMNTGETNEFELAYPWEIDAQHNRVSVLAPIGTAVLGIQVGDIIKWPVPAGLRRLQVAKILYQPERAAALRS
ncbi:MAG: nucleoside diphosphate kinase regulator [Gemmataceae bacterium]